MKLEEVIEVAFDDGQNAEVKGQMTCALISLANNANVGILTVTFDLTSKVKSNFLNFFNYPMNNIG